MGVFVSNYYRIGAPPRPCTEPLNSSKWSWEVSALRGRGLMSQKFSFPVLEPIMQNRKLALKPEVNIFEICDPAHAERKPLRIILSYSTAPCMVWVEPQSDSNLRQKHPFFRLWEFAENSRGTLEDKCKNDFDSAWQALSDGVVSLVTKSLLVVENFSLSHWVDLLQRTYRTGKG